MRSNIIVLAIILVITATGSAQPPHPAGPPHPPPPGEHGMGAPGMAPRPGDWIRPHDENDNKMLEESEFQAAIERTFALLDKNANGVLETEELGPTPKLQQPPPAGGGPGRPAPMNRALPPFFLRQVRSGDHSLTREEFERVVRAVFAEMDENGDATLSLEEIQKHQPPHPAAPPPPPHAPMPPNALFIGSELRFGDKHVKGQPFSAEILIEETRRLFDGSTVTKQNRGAIYRDAAGRTRREQPLEMVAGVQVVGGDNKPQMMVFINDFGSQSHIFLDNNNKIARKSRIGGNIAPRHEPGMRSKEKTESLGAKTIEGVRVEGTRSTFEIPVGHIGNDKPIAVTAERWFSPELQVLVSSRHVDPIAGEHVFRLVNIKRLEPVAELFSIPAGYRIQ